MVFTSLTGNNETSLKIRTGEMGKIANYQHKDVP
jgi:hypothetical protein